MLSLITALVSGSAVGQSAADSIDRTALTATNRLVMMDGVHSPSVIARTFSNFAAKNQTVGDSSRTAVVQPVSKRRSLRAETVTTGSVRALVINIQLANGAVTDRWRIMPGYLAEAIELRQMSRGLFDVQVDFFGRNVVVSVPDCSPESLETILTKASQQAALELNLDQYRFISFVIPESLVCGFSGLADTPGQFTWIKGRSGDDIQVGLVGHEWAHNLGLFHPTFMQCRVNNAPTQFASRAMRDKEACTSNVGHWMFSLIEYFHQGAISFVSRFQLGWLRQGEFQTVSKGTYTLNFDAAPALLMLQNSEGDRFMIEYLRAPTIEECSCGTYDNVKKKWLPLPVPFVDGVSVHYVSRFEADPSMPSGYSLTSHLLDMNPSTSTWQDAMLQDGQSFVDPTGTLQIDVTSVGSSSATVNINMPGIPFRPRSPSDLVARPQEKLGLVDVAWSAVVTTYPVTHYELQISSQSDFAESATTTFLFKGTTGTVTIPSAASLKDYWVRVAAVNAGGRSDFAKASTILNWSKLRPNVPIGFKVSQPGRLGLVNVAWTAVVAATPVAHYELQISSQSDFTESATTTVLIKGTTGTVLISGAEYLKYYWLRVAAVNDNGLSDFTEAGSAYGWSPPVESVAEKVGSSCSFKGARTTSGKQKLVCKKIGKKLVWKKG